MSALRSSARPVGAPSWARRGALAGAAALALAPAAATASPWAAPAGVLAAPAAGDAGEADEAPMAAAQEAFQQGTQAYALGNYDQAVALFERSYALSGRPELLFNLGQAYAQWYSLSGDLAHLRKARKLYQNYIKFLEASDDVDPEAITDTRARIAEIDAELAARDAAAHPEEPPVGPAPPPEVEPGPPEPAPPPADAPRRPLHRRGWFWGVLVGAAVVIAAGVTAGVLATRDRPVEPELGTIRGLPWAPPSAGIRFGAR